MVEKIGEKRRKGGEAAERKGDEGERGGRRK